LGNIQALLKEKIEKQSDQASVPYFLANSQFFKSLRDFVVGRMDGMILTQHFPDEVTLSAPTA